MQASLSCSTCLQALILPDDELANMGLKYSLIRSKDRGGLLMPSVTVVKLVEASEKAFQVLAIENSTSGLSGDRNLHLRLLRMTSRYSTTTHLTFYTLEQHDVESTEPGGEVHSSQLRKKICELYLGIRLKSYSKVYNTEVIQAGKVGARQKACKVLLFQGLQCSTLLPP